MYIMEEGFSSAVMIHGLLLFGAYSDGEKEDNTAHRHAAFCSVCVCVCVCVCGVAVAGSMRAACDRERRERTIFSVLRCVTDGSALCRYIVFLVK